MNTEVGKDKNQLGINVHIVPLGFEFERAIAPFVNRHVDKVILVFEGGDTSNPDDNSREQKKFTEKVETNLIDKGITVEKVETTTFDLNALIREYSKLIRREKDAGNLVSINISSSGRLASVAAAFAGMAHNINVYYVKATGYSKTEQEREESGVSKCDCENPEVIVLENFQLKLPKEEESLVLEYLYMRKRELKDPWTSPKQIGNILHQVYPERYPWNPLLERKPKEEFKKENSDTASTAETTDEYSKYRTKQAAFLIKFQTSLARDLEAENYIERKNNEKKHVYYQITSSGEYALYLYGLSNKMTVGKDDIILTHP